MSDLNVTWKKRTIRGQAYWEACDSQSGHPLGIIDVHQYGENYTLGASRNGQQFSTLREAKAAALALALSLGESEQS